MGSREDQPTPHLSSLVVRPTDSGGANGGSDYEPGEVRRDPPSYSRSDRFADSHGYRMHSLSPVHHRRYSPDLDHSGGPPPRSRGFGSARLPGRPHRHYSPPYSRAREAGRFVGRSYDRRPGYGVGKVRGKSPPRSNPNVRPRDGDWMCADPSCNNLNFARREICNKCRKPRYGLVGGSPRMGGYHGPPRRLPGPHPINRTPPGRFEKGYRSPPRTWARDEPRDFRAGLPHSRFPDPPTCRERPDFADAPYRDRGRFERPLPLDFGHRDRGRESYLNERKGYERRITSPPPPLVLPARGYIRDRSRSPVRGGPPPSKDYPHDLLMGRGRDDRRVGRDAY